MGYTNKAISSDDPNAVEKLKEKLEKCEKMQEHMKKVNAYYRKNGTCKGFPDMPNDKAAELDNSLKTRYPWAKAPYLPFELTNNSAEIRRLKKRISQLECNKEIGFAGWKFEGGEAVINNEINRLQLVFDEKPDDEKRNILKINGFHWSPVEGAWQRQLNANAIYAADRIEFIKPECGMKPTQLQPKQKNRENER